MARLQSARRRCRCRTSDARYLDGKRVVLFGPFATFSTKFLKNGSFFDLLSTTTTNNVLPMTHVGLDNFDLVKYLVSQVMLSDDDRFAALEEYYPDARKEDWKPIQAGQRVQIIKKDAEKGGVLSWYRSGGRSAENHFRAARRFAGGFHRRADHPERAQADVPAAV